MPPVTDRLSSGAASVPTFASVTVSPVWARTVSVSVAFVRTMFVPVKSMLPTPLVASSVGVPSTAAEAAALYVCVPANTSSVNVAMPDATVTCWNGLAPVPTGPRMTASPACPRNVSVSVPAVRPIATPVKSMAPAPASASKIRGAVTVADAAPT